jgi:hypothetical protein
MTTKSYVGDTGTRITLDCGTDISTSSARTIEVRKPDGSTASWTATLSGTTGVYYDTAADTLDMPGTWRLQARVTIGSGVWRGETVLLQVYPAFG